METLNAEIIKTDKYIQIRYGDRAIRIALKHNIYQNDIIYDFDSYFNAVEYSEENGLKIVDYSVSKPHNVNGYTDHQIMFSSFAEPVTTAAEYKSFAQLNENSIVLDLGAYSGLTSILFDKEISKFNKQAKGQVISVDADIYNTPCINYNFLQYKQITGREIKYLYGAVWGEDGEIEFSNEANMGASATSIVGTQRDSKITKVQSYTLSTIAKNFKLKRIDFVKCDVEGGEISVFKDKNFFKKFQPKIIVETHFLGSKEKTAAPIVKEMLENYGYTVKEISQNATLYAPILECYPPNKMKMFLNNLKNILQMIFSLKNKENHKIITILGIKLKIRRNHK